MNNDSIISIIIPAYNVKNYILECLNSVASQSFRQIEIICIDDGSTDGTRDLLTEFSRKDARVVALFNEKNYGQGYSRNKGLKNAKGDYVLFVDADDLLKDNALMKLQKELNQYSDLDYLIFGYDELSMEVEEERSLIEYVPINDVNDYCNITGVRQASLLMHKGVYNGKCFTRLWRRDYLIENSLFFKEGIMYEDMLFVFQSMLYAKHVGYLNDCLYNYRHRSGSLMMSGMSAFNLRSLVIVYASIFHEIHMSSVSDEDLIILLQYASRLKRLITSMGCEILMQNANIEGIQFEDDYQRICFFDAFVHGHLNLFQLAKILRNVKREGLVLVYGAGNVGKQVIETLPLFGMYDVHVVVSRLNDHRMVFGYTTECIDEFVTEKETALVIVAAAGKKAIDMKNNAEVLGYSNVCLIT